MARGEISEGRKRETALVIVVVAGALVAAGYHQVRVRWPWLLGEPASERIGATIRCEAEGLDVEPIAVPTAVTWPAAPVYDALRVRVRPAGGVLGQDLTTSTSAGEVTIDTGPLPEPLRAALRACVERERSALGAAIAGISTPPAPSTIALRP